MVVKVKILFLVPRFKVLSLWNGEAQNEEILLF